MGEPPKGTTPRSLKQSCKLSMSTGIFDDEFIEERRKGLEEFLNK